MELKNQIVEMDAFSNHKKLVFKRFKKRLKCESAEVNWNPTSKTEIQKELPLRTEFFQ